MVKNKSHTVSAGSPCLSAADQELAAVGWAFSSRARNRLRRQAALRLSHPQTAHPSPGKHADSGRCHAWRHRSPARLGQPSRPRVLLRGAYDWCRATHGERPLLGGPNRLHHESCRGQPGTGARRLLAGCRVTGRDTDHCPGIHPA